MSAFDDFIPEVKAPRKGGSAFDDFIPTPDDSVRRSLTVVESSGLSPDQAAEALALSKKTGIPRVAVEDNLSEVKQQAERSSLLDVARNDPNMAWMLSDPNIAKIGRDDVENLSAISKAMRMSGVPVLSTIGAFSEITGTNPRDFADIGRAAAGGPVQAIGAGISGIGAMSEVVQRRTDQGLRWVGGDDLVDVNRMLSRVMNPFGQIQANPEIAENLQTVGGWLKEASRRISPPEARQNIATDIAGAIGQVGGQIAVSAINPVVGVGMFLGQGADIIDERVDEVGAQGTAASDAAIFGGAGVMAVAEKLGLNALLNRVPPQIKNNVLRQIADISLAGGIEAVQETIEGIGLNLVTQQLVNPEQELIDSSLSREAIAAGGTGAFVRGLINATTRGRNLAGQEQQARSAQEKAAVIDQVAELSRDDILRQRDPESFASFMGMVGQRQGIDDIYIPADRVVEYFQSQDIDPYSLDGIDSGELAAAIATGGDVAIPFGTYMTNIAPAHHAGLSESIRLSEDAWTAQEAAEMQANVDQIVEAESSAVMEQMARERADSDASNAVFDDVRSQLIAAGVSREVAGQQAAPIQALMRTLANDYGADVGSIWQRFRPTIMREVARPETLARVDDVDLFIADAKEYERRQTRRSASERATDLLGRATGRSRSTPRPLVNYLSSLGGIDPQGEFAVELRAMDITPRNTPKLFKRSGRRDVDNIPASEFDNHFAGGDIAAVQDGNGYVDRQYLLDMLRRESEGDYIRTPEQRQRQEREAAYEDFSRYLDSMGLSIESPTADIKAAIDNVGREPDALYQNGSLNTESEAFKRWFGDSKVVDADGKPLVVYHGTRSADVEEFRDFSAEDFNERPTFFFTDDPSVASTYAEAALTDEDAPNVVPVYVRMENPLIVDAGGTSYRDIPFNGGKYTSDYIANKAGEMGNDGLIVTNVRDDFSSSKSRKPSTIYVAFSPTQIKSVHNRGTFDPNDARILYQDGERDLLAQHNISLRGLLNVDKLGGLPVPSLAVSKKDAPLENFGEITLLANKSLIDPKENKASKVFGADVYSPRYPSVSYDYNMKALSALERSLEPYAEKISENKSDWWNLLPRSDRVEERGIEAFEESAALAARFLDAKGVALPAQEKYSDGSVSLHGTARKIVEVARGVDGYSDYAASVGESIITKERIFDGFTPSGNRRYLAHNLDTVVRILKRGLRDGEGFNYGVGSIRAKFTKQYKSLEQLSKDRDKIISSDDFDKAKEGIDAEFWALAEKWREHVSEDQQNSFGFADNFSEHLKEAATGRLSQINAEYYGGRVPDSVLNETAAFLNALRDMPTEYFEAKIQRAVQLQEFEAAVMPEGAEYDAAEALLKKRGLDVVRYNKSVPSARRDAIQQFERVFFQRTGTERGSFSPQENVIRLFQAENLSTFLHESGHWWLETYSRVADDIRQQIERGGDVDPQQREGWERILRNHEAILNHIGAERGQPFTVEQHEKFARTAEAYFMTGKAPSIGLQSAFDRFKDWLIRIYQNVRSLNVEMSPEIVDAMDRMLATDREIREAERLAHYDLIDIEGATPVEQATLDRLNDRATDEADRILLEKVMKPIERRKRKWWKDEWQKVNDAVRLEFEQKPEWRAVDMARGTDSVPAVKLDIRSLEEQFGLGIKGLLPRGMTTRSNGIDPAMMAEEVGVANARELVELLSSIRDTTLNAAIRGETDARMDAAYGDPLNDGSIEQEARDAIHNMRRGEYIAEQLNILRRIGAGDTVRRAAERRVVADGVQDAAAYTSEADSAASGIERMAAQEAGRAARLLRAHDRAGRAELDAAMSDVRPRDIRSAAQVLVGRMKVKDLNKTARFARAEVKSADASRDYIARRDYAQAAFHKYQQLLNHYLYMEAKDAQAETETITGYLRNLAEKKTVSSMDQGYLEQIHGLLEKFDFKRATQREVERRTSFAEWVASQEALGHEIVAPEKLIAQSQTQHYSGIPLNELRSLRDTVKQIEHLGRLKQKLVDGQEEREFNAVVAEAVESIYENSSRISDAVNVNQSERDKVFSTLRGLDATLLKMEQMFSWLDNGKVGVFGRLFQRMSEAQAKENDLTVEYVKKLRAALDGIDGNRMDEVITLPSVMNRDGELLRFKRSDIIALALNYGNDGNISRILNPSGNNLTEQNVHDLIGNLNKQELEAVNEIWELVDSLWPQVVELEKRVNGVAPKKVEARPFKAVSDDGEVVDMRGGYYPIIYDPTRSEQAAQHNEQDQAARYFGGNYVRATTAKGHTQEREAVVGRPIQLDMNLLPRHFTQVIHDLTHREVIIDADRFLNDSRIKRAVSDVLGVEYAREFRPWLHSIAGDRTTDPNSLEGWNRLAGKFRMNMSVMAMGFRASTVIAQFGGLSAGAEMIGQKWLRAGLKEFYGHGSPREILSNIDMVLEKSGEMRHRANNMDRDYRDVLRSINNKTRKNYGDNVRRWAMMGISYADRGVAMPVWLGAYQKGLSENMDDGTAISYADKVVRLTQSAGGAKDLSRVQRGTNNEFFKWATMFYSYFNAMYARQRDIGRTFARSDKTAADFGELLARSWWLMILPSVATQLAVGRGPDDDEEWATWIAGTVAAYPFASIPFVRDIVGSLESGYGYKITPISRGGESLVKLAKNIADVPTGEADAQKLFGSAMDVLGFFTGMPTGQVKTSTNYLWDVLEGEEDPEGIVEGLRGFAFGPKK